MKRLSDIQKFHSRLLTQEPNYYRMAGWGSVNSQRQRFDAMVRAAQFVGGSVVDFGCGPGDLLPFLQERGHKVHYLGLDQSEEMIRLATQRHGEHFAVIGLDQIDFESVDYVFGSGIFQFRGDDDGVYVSELLAGLFSRCQKATAVTFLSALRPESEKVPEEMYFSPGEVVEMAQALTGFWTIDHSYHVGLGDFTVGLHKRGAGCNWVRPK